MCPRPKGPKSCNHLQGRIGFEIQNHEIHFVFFYRLSAFLYGTKLAIGVVYFSTL